MMGIRQACDRAETDPQCSVVLRAVLEVQNKLVKMQETQIEYMQQNEATHREIIAMLPVEKVNAIARHYEAETEKSKENNKIIVGLKIAVGAGVILSLISVCMGIIYVGVVGTLKRDVHTETVK